MFFTELFDTYKAVLSSEQRGQLPPDPNFFSDSEGPRISLVHLFCRNLNIYKHN